MRRLKKHERHKLMKTTTTKKDFHNALKYGRSYMLVKKHVDILCEAITNKLDGKYSVKYTPQSYLFIVSVHVPSWDKLPLHIDSNKIDTNLFMTAHLFAITYLNSVNYLYWTTAGCEVPGQVEYRISFIG